MAYKAHSDDYSYYGRHVLETLDISRSSLMYYERMGLISPERTDDDGYRKYADTDVFSLFAYTMLRNIGYASAESAERITTLHDVLDGEYIAEYTGLIEKRIRYDKALLEVLHQIEDDRARIVNAPYVPIFGDLPMFKFYSDNAEQGYDRIKPSEALRTLVKHIPLTSFGVLFEGDVFNGDLDIHWGRMLPERYEALVPLDAEPSGIVGGGMGYKLPVMVRARRMEYLSLFRLINEQMMKDGMHVVGHAFLACCYAVSADVFQGTLFVPAEPVS